MKKSMSLLTALLLLITIVAGCTVQSAEPQSESPSSTSLVMTSETNQASPAASDLPLQGIKVGVSASYLEDDFCIAMNYGIVDRLKALGADVTLTNSNSDGEMQSKQIKAFIELGVKYLFVNPPTRDVCVPALEEAAAAGIMIILFDGGANTDKGIITHVSMNNKMMGNTLGEYMADYIKNNLNGKATIIYEYWMEMERMQDRIDGVKEIIDAAGLDITSVDLDSKGSRETAANVTANYAGDYDLIISGEMNTAWGAISTLEAQNNDHVKVVAVADASKEGYTAIRDNNKYYLTFCAASPTYMAEYSVNALLKYIRGEKQDLVTYIETPVCTPANVDQFWDFVNSKFK